MDKFEVSVHLRDGLIINLHDISAIFITEDHYTKEPIVVVEGARDTIYTLSDIVRLEVWPR